MGSGGHRKNQEIFGWLQILMKILFNEITHKLHIFRVMRIGGYMFPPHQMGGGHKNIAEVLSEIHDPPIPKKMVAPNTMVGRDPIPTFKFVDGN